jgi:hypothetical protein
MPEPTVDLEAEQARVHEVLRDLQGRHVPLSVAAAVVFHEAHGGAKAVIRRADYDDALNMAAAALSRLVRVRRATGPIESDEEMAVDLTQQRFARGATELRGPNHAVLRGLLVRRAELHSALSVIRRAGITFAFDLLPPGPPGPVDLNQTSPSTPR